MRLIRCVWSLDSALGGVQEAIRQACLGLAGLGHSVEVVCLDEPDAPWLRNYPARVHALGPPGLALRGASLIPYGYSGRFIQWMRAHAEKYDAVVVDGLWQFTSIGTWFALRKSDVPYFVCTHSMLDPWFKHRYPSKHLKKWLYWILLERRVLRDARAVLYISEREKTYARRSFLPYRVKEEVSAGLAIGAPPERSSYQRGLFLDTFPELRARRLLLFLGRIHPVKGCDLLVEAFAEVCRKDPSLHLVLAGPDPVGWRQVLEERVAELGLEERVTWTGMLSGDIKWGALRCAEAFVLPSHTEGFPVAAIESMACGTPVLISDKVGIWREIYEAGGAFVARDDLEGITNLLESWLRLAPDERKHMKRRVAEGYARQFAASVVNERFISVLRGLGVGEGSRANEVTHHETRSSPADKGEIL
jgi:glycosyltransferase involved in cell wall biosynthesis